MRCINDKGGFSLVEVMIATLIMTLGLAGVAAMQLTAMNGIFIAGSQANGSATALAWSEWLNGLIAHQDQDKNDFTLIVNEVSTLKHYRENYIALASLDANQYDSFNPDTYAPDAKGDDGKPEPVLGPFVQVELPDSLDDLADCFNGVQEFEIFGGGSIRAEFKKEGGLDFTPADMPPPAPPGARLVMRIAANVPVKETTTVEVAVIYANAFVHDRGAALRFVVASNM